MPGGVNQPAQYVDVSPWSFALWWLLLLAVHAAAGGYNAAYAMFYWELKDTYLYLCLEYSRIGMTAEHHDVIVAVNAVLAAMHGGCIAWMAGASAWRRQLAFSPWPQGTQGTFRNSRMGPSMRAVETATEDRFASRIVSARLRSAQLYEAVWGRQGVLGVNGSNFHAILVGRELLETVLQTVQAYRMSWYLPRMLLNRFYLSLLVLNCWSSVVIYSLLFRRNEPRRRFACLLCDCILDLVSCMGVPLMIVLSYLDEYDAELTGFDMEKWYDDAWSARTLNEFQLVVVISWSDLASRAIFSFGLILTTSSLKELLRKDMGANGSKRRIALAADSVRIPDKKREVSGMGPVFPEGAHGHDASKLVKVEGRYGETGLRSRGSRFMLQMAHLGFGVWGVVVLAFHIQASLQQKSPQCVLQVHPWVETEPSCYLVLLDCDQLGIAGERAEVEAMWSEFDRSSVVTLVMRHCPALQIPDMLGDFHLLSGIKVYNSTIESWEASAAITNANHPELIWFYLVRVDLKDGVLPAGAQSPDFPANLYDIEFCFTNLRELPDDLDAKWMIGTSIYMEYCQLANVPLVLTRLNPYYLALTASPSCLDTCRSYPPYYPLCTSQTQTSPSSGRGLIHSWGEALTRKPP